MHSAELPDHDKIPDEFVKNLKKQYHELFSEKIVKLMGFKAKIHVQHDAKPKFCKPRKVPFALEEAEFKRLENDGVIESIPYSDWASPIVIVPKADDQVRICGSFKETINPFIHTEQYPLPNPDELFQKLQGGQLFTKLDLKAAYLQMELDNESKKYLVINTPDGLKRNNRMVYGGSSGPAIFQRYLENLLSNVEMTAVNQDDVVIVVS